MEIFAHRGASAIAPESTRAAIVAAVKAKADGIELDVQMTKDRRLVIFHDDQLKRTTNGRGHLTKKTYPELKKLDAGSWFDKQFSGEPILLASQVFGLLPKKVAVNFELKRTPKRAMLISRVMRLLRRQGVSHRVLISSFDQRLLRPFAGTSFAYALIANHQPKRSLRRAIRLGCQAWHPRAGMVTPKLINEAHAAGLKVRAWTVDELLLARRLKRWGVDGIFTNDPKRLKRVLS